MQNTQADKDFALQWADRWFQLVDLYFSLVRTDGPTSSPPPPTDLDEIKYQAVRFWLMDHEEQFKALWKDFYQSKEWALKPDDELLVYDRDIQRCCESPFFFCYTSENLYRLMQELGVQSGIDLWLPSAHQSWTVAMGLLQFSKRVAQFHSWVCDMTEGALREDAQS